MAAANRRFLLIGIDLIGIDVIGIDLQPPNKAFGDTSASEQKLVGGTSRRNANADQEVVKPAWRTRHESRRRLSTRVGGYGVT